MTKALEMVGALSNALSQAKTTTQKFLPESAFSSANEDSLVKSRTIFGNLPTRSETTMLRTITSAITIATIAAAIEPLKPLPLLYKDIPKKSLKAQLPSLNHRKYNCEQPRI